MKKAFTLIEMMVAISLLAMMVGFSSIIFKSSIDAYRVSGANAEIMQKVQAITTQLDSDFAGLQKDMPLMIWFEQNPADVNQRYDQIMFFATGDFTSTQLYSIGVNNVTLRGNAARIYYGQGGGASYLTSALLARRQHILTANTSVAVYPMTNLTNFIPANEQGYEHDSICFSEWRNFCNSPVNNDRVILTCFDNGNRTPINLKQPVFPIDTIHNLMSEGVGSFAIQWGYRFVSPSPPIAAAIDEYRWWPSGNPDNDSTTTGDSDFTDAMGVNQFGIYFNLAGGTTTVGWYGPVLTKDVYLASGGKNLNWNGAYVDSFPAKFYPEALKFTFTLYDSKRIFKNGQTFTHIVYLGKSNY